MQFDLYAFIVSRRKKASEAVFVSKTAECGLFDDIPLVYARKMVFFVVVNQKKRMSC